jgi:steroid delta-isomerase-like uncharacterized protein
VSTSALEEVGGLAARWRAALASGDRELFASCCSAAVAYEDPVTPEPIEGLDAIADHAARYRDAFPDLRLEPMGQSLCEGDFACVPWRLLGTHRGSFAGVPASGRFVVIQGLHYLELADGRVRRARGFFDLYDAGVQLGLLPSRGSLAESALLLIRGFGLRPRA